MSQPVCAETKENETAKSTDHSGGKIKNEKSVLLPVGKMPLIMVPQKLNII